MSIKVMTWVWDHAPVSGNELLLLLAIGDQADDSGQNAWPSIHTLAQRTRLDQRTVQRVVKRLSTCGNLVVHNGGGRRSNRYSIPMSDQEQALSTPPAGRHPRQPATGGEPPSQARRDAAAGMAQPRHPTPGAAVPPDPPSTRPGPDHLPHAGTRASEEPRLQVVSTTGGGGIEQGVIDVLTGLGPEWILTPSQRRRLAPGVSAALTAGWTVPRLTEYLSANPHGVRSPAAVLAARLDDLPAPAEPPAERPAWCGECDETTRHIEHTDGRVERCPACHPKRAGPDGAGDNPARHRSRQAPTPRRANPQGDVTPRETDREEHHQCPPPPSRDAC